MKAKRKQIWQKHHIYYKPEVLVPVTRAEHFYLTRLSFFKGFSKGFRKAIKTMLRDKPEVKRDIENH